MARQDARREDSTVSDLLLVLITFFLPPVTAFITDGCGGQFCLNLLLTFLGFIPGFIHALWLIYRRSSAASNYGQGPASYRYQDQPSQYAVVNPPQQHQGYAPPPTEPVYVKQ